MSLLTPSRTANVLNQFLDPVCDVLTPEVAQAIVNLRASQTTQARIDDFAARHHEGQLGGDELAEYEALVNGANLVSVLQAKARTVLRRPVK